MNYEKVQEYMTDLNRRKVGGFDDWRLPTLEEAMTLMQPQKQNTPASVPLRCDLD